MTPVEAEVRVVRDVPAAFAALVADLRPARFGLTGGSTGRRCYEQLASAGVDWTGTELFLSDERWVPVDHEDSNEGQARGAWLDSVPHGRLWSLREAGATREEAADAYHDLLAGVGRLDVLHLGLGDDGHVASLFPGATSLDVRDRLVVPAGDEAHPRERLTFTFPAIAMADLVVLTATGEGKRAAFAEVRAGDRSLPATRIEADRVLWLVDEATAGVSAGADRR